MTWRREDDLDGDGRLDGRYCFTGAAAVWSLTN
jgi:hypothetical protein